jgi:hypothetical protein
MIKCSSLQWLLVSVSVLLQLPVTQLFLLQMTVDSKSQSTRFFLKEYESYMLLSGASSASTGRFLGSIKYSKRPNKLRTPIKIKIVRMEN